MMESWGRFVHDGDPGWPALEAGRGPAVAVFGGAAGTQQVELSSDDDVIAPAHT
jgi:hypothetical protein